MPATDPTAAQTAYDDAQRALTNRPDDTTPERYRVLLDARDTAIRELRATQNPPASVLPRPEAGAHIHTEGREDCTHRLPQCCWYCHAARDEVTHAEHLAAITAGIERRECDCCDCYGCYDARELATEKRDELAHEDVGHAALAVVLPLAAAVLMVILAAGNGRLGYLVHHLPVVPPLSGGVLLGLAAVVLYAVRRLRRTGSAPDVARLADLDVVHPSDRPLMPDRGPFRDLWQSEEDWVATHYPSEVEQW